MCIKRLLFSSSMIWLGTLTSFSQNHPSTAAKAVEQTKTGTLVSNQTQDEKNSQELSNTPQGKNNLRLGLPVSATAEEYAVAKQKMYMENREKYNELFNQKNTSTNPSVRKVKRSHYDTMLAEQKARIDAHPELFIIID